MNFDPAPIKMLKVPPKPSLAFVVLRLAETQILYPHPINSQSQVNVERKKKRKKRKKKEKVLESDPIGC